MNSQAKYYDGQNANPHEVTLRSNGLELLGKSIDGNVLFRWRITELHVVQQPSSSTPAIVSLNNTPDARLYMQEEFFKELLPLLTKSGKPFHIPATFVSISLWFFAAIFITAAAFWVTPKLAKPIAAVIPEAWEEAMGDKVVSIMTKDKVTCDVPEGVTALNIMIARLQDNNENMQDLEPNVRVVQIQSTNAFAAPAGRMVIFSKLITAADSPEEVAGVMAHEFGHIIKRHPTEASVRSLGMALILQLMFGSDAQSLTSVGKFIVDMSYSRDAEHEADAIAFTLLENAQIDPQGLSDFFTRMIKQSEAMQDLFKIDETINEELSEEVRENLDKGLKILDYFSSHPDTQLRIDALAKKKKSNSYTPLLSEQEWKDLQNICGDADLEEEPMPSDDMEAKSAPSV